MELRYTEGALLDLVEIRDYIARDAPIRASSFVREVKDHCEKLSRNPLLRPLVPNIGPDVRRSVFGSYNIYYFIEGDQIVIFGVIEGHRRQHHALKGRGQ